MDEPPLINPNSNWNHWQHYCRDIPAPQSFIDWNFYYLIGSCLQRRVWIGDMDHGPLFPNIYAVLVGPPACGKGISIRPTAQALNHWKLPPPDKVNGEIKGTKEITPEDMAREAEIQTMLSGDRELQERFEKRNSLKKDKLVFPLGANSTTYESLAQTICESVRYIKHNIPGNKVPSIYSHCSLAIVLTELSSLLKRNTENIVNALTDLYDCVPYTYKTKNKGEDVIRKGCINMLAGTTFSYMEDIFSDRILNDGFASRSFFLVETKPRFFRWNFGKPSEEQKASYQKILNYIKSLSTIHGEVRFSEDAEAYLTNWWEKDHEKIISNKDPRLESYYGRKNNHARKISMILHFSENQFVNGSEGICRMEIPLKTVMRALDILTRAERNMHMALSFSGNNMVAKASRRLLKMLKDKGEMNWKDIQVALMDGVMRMGEIKEVVEYLEGVEQIRSKEATDPNQRRWGLVYSLVIDTEVPLTQGITEDLTS